MSPSDKFDAIVAVLTVMYVATWLCLSGWASVTLGDVVRARTGSRRGAVITARLMFLVVGVGGAMAIQALIW